ncbi:MAG: V-type ATP synthase subunit E family protein [Candidatus Jordarchaeaceae archaeon]
MKAEGKAVEGEEVIVEGAEEPEAERLKKIISRIEEEAEERAKAIIEEAKAKAKEIEEEALGRAEKKAEEIIKRGKEEAEGYRRRRLAEAKLKAKQRKTKAQEQLIEMAFQKANEKLVELTSSKEYPKILERLVQNAAINIGGGELEVLLPEGHSKYLTNASAIAKNVEAETKNPTNVTISKETVDATGGCVVRRKDGSVSVDNTFQAILERKIKEVRVKVAKVLLG